ncbi:tetratricopeptide repeat protein [Streptosporangium sp. NPDC048865]|uniref:tetratricopeptide repeat protein n=1 Tax=Streptosporangium sp. NPDC048865 TaxID=3155766 RepID=UPI00342E3C4E
MDQESEWRLTKAVGVPGRDGGVVLGGDHPNSLSSRNNPAIAYDAAGNLDRAIPPYEQALAICVRILGGRVARRESWRRPGRPPERIARCPIW